MSSPLPGATQSPATQSTGSSANPLASLTGATDPLANEETFLQLLVSQLQNQDPTNPVDGTTFVTQLAEFNNVEQSLAMRQDLDAVSEKYLGTTTPPSQASSTTIGQNQAIEGLGECHRPPWIELRWPPSRSGMLHLPAYVAPGESATVASAWSRPSCQL